MTPVTDVCIARGYQKRPSIADYLPWKNYSNKHKLFLLEGDKSLGVCYEKDHYALL